MAITDLRAGDKVFIREDLEHGEIYQGVLYVNGMGSGVMRIKHMHPSGIFFSIPCKGHFLHYSKEMIDWEKTRKIREIEFKEIVQCGECGNEITKATMHNGRKITVKNSNEENDVEKAVMLLMLKARGFTYSDIKKEVEKVKVKWKPTEDDRYYYIREIGDVSSCFWNELSWDYYRFDFNNCFKTIEEAEEKLEKIKEVLKGE